MNRFFSYLCALRGLIPPVCGIKKSSAFDHARIGPLWISLSIIFVLIIGGCTAGKPRPTSAPPPGEDSGLLAFYRGPLDHLQAVRSGACPMHPSCSAYAREAVAAHGPVKGWIMVMDRLLRCGRDEGDHAPTIYINGLPKIHDPLPGNDLW